MYPKYQIKYPSIETIMRIHPGGIRDNFLNRNDAKLVRKIMKGNYETLFKLPEYEKYYQRYGKFMYNPHTIYELKMHMLDIVIGGYGVESFVSKDGYCDYVNLGDTYDTTIVYFKNRFSVCSWGDIAEHYLD